MTATPSPLNPEAADLTTANPTDSAETKLRARIYVLELLAGAIADATYRAAAVVRLSERTGLEADELREDEAVLSGLRHCDRRVRAQIDDAEAAVASLESGAVAK